ncbi:hypothetical protein B0T26DRAFT_476844 [Lasiosphaeria miniovina]|uniref:Uncharacterized protein n=1 Tax=Lasiosphaeria miniovina TaxID=1954250 RepID=A0AA40A049_9PEZI|nr:uncharacterized protein B0T26DRAFT_476844 [Lasiosphaeria miniovina]KAK0706853.1 hypothetical protein B0T26DRAFT_476844 [Lasiosphaeria miniovina]
MPWPQQPWLLLLGKIVRHIAEVAGWLLQMLQRLSLVRRDQSRSDPSISPSTDALGIISQSDDALDSPPVPWDDGQLVPVNTTSLQPDRLCRSCKDCVRSCGIETPAGLHSRSYASAMMGSPFTPATRYSYSSFSKALRDRCFVCNTLLRNNKRGMPLAIPKSD